MSYQPISVREAVAKINNSINGWFLPAIQRPYVWGSRHENELYICKLFDSILRGYPIGGLIIWNTEESVQYREFMGDYLSNEDSAKLVEEGLWSKKDKGLVYDGQQRLQTLYSCLKYTFNDKILVFDLLFKRLEDKDTDETGFLFVPKNTELECNYVKMNFIFSKEPDECRKIEKDILRRNSLIAEEKEDIIRENFSKLWKVFVEQDKKSLSFFPIVSKNESEVNEIFERLNSGGIPLSQADLLFTTIKTEHYDFEEKLQNISKTIFNITNKGFQFNAYHILQLLNLIVMGTIRIDHKKVRTKEKIRSFHDSWTTLEKPLVDFFVYFIWGQFRINNSSVIPSRAALLPLIVYYHELYKKGFNHKHIDANNLLLLKEYFIKSQINDWSLQSYTDNSASLIHEEAVSSMGLFNFPKTKIDAFVNSKGKRSVDIKEEAFAGYTWFALKVLTPNRVYQFDPDIQGRFKPEIDHIFPKNLAGQNNAYKEMVDIIWNMQPIQGDINNFKSNLHPKEFFTDKARNADGVIITGSKYVADYDFMLPLQKDGTIDFSSDVWDSPDKFIKLRKQKMLEFIGSNYGISIVIAAPDLENHKYDHGGVAEFVRHDSHLNTDAEKTYEKIILITKKSTSIFHDAAEQALKAHGEYTILCKKAGDRLWFLPSSLSEILPENASDGVWNHLSKRISVCCWFCYGKNKGDCESYWISLAFECCKMRDVEQRLRFVNYLKEQKEFFKLTVKAFRRDATYSKFFMRYEDDVVFNEKSVQDAVSKLLTDNQRYFQKLDEVCREFIKQDK